MIGIEKNPRKVEAYICLGHIFLLTRSFEDAYKMLESAENISPNSEDVINLRNILEQEV